MKLLSEYGINLDNSKLIETALTHTSYANEHKTTSYERLEYLGDSVLELVCSEYLYNKFESKEGEMSRLRSLYVCENALFEYSKKINLSEYIKVGNGIKEPNKTVIADVFEAVIGVIYLEKGLNEVKRFFNILIAPYIDNKVDFLSDYKSLLQEEVQTDRKSVEYVITKEEGPAHCKKFTVDVLVDNIVYGTGTGNSKKEAEQAAAKDALRKQA